MAESKIDGVLRARGALSAEVQKIVRTHCERGNAQEMIEKVAGFLLADGIAKGRIPSNAGMKTQDLLDRTESALRREAQDYHSKGGVLISKGYVSIEGLTAEMAKQWLRDFSVPIPTETNIKGTLSDPEIQDRLTVTALKLKSFLLEKATGDEYVIVLKRDDLEGICQRASIEMFRAFEQPNEANHEIIHGEKT